MMVPKADRDNGLRSEAPAAPEKATRRPIRKRGYHRALKRGELWATRIEFMQAMQAKTSAFIHGPIPDSFLNETLSGLAVNPETAANKSPRQV